MAVTKSGTVTQGGGVSQTTVSFSPTSQINSGDMAILAIGRINVNFSNADVAVSDNHGNTWHSFGSQGDTIDDVVTLWWSSLGTTLATSDTITIGSLNLLSNGMVLAILYGATNMGTTSDGTPASAQLSASPWNSGNVTTTATDLLFGVFCSASDEPSTIASGSSVPSAGWTTDVLQFPTSVNNLIRVAYNPSNAAGTYHLNGTLTAVFGAAAIFGALEQGSTPPVSIAG